MVFFGGGKRANILKWCLEKRGLCGPWGGGGEAVRASAALPPQFLGGKGVHPGLQHGDMAGAGQKPAGVETESGTGT